MPTPAELLSVLALLQFVVWDAVALVLDFRAALPVLPVFLLFVVALYAYSA